METYFVLVKNAVVDYADSNQRQAANGADYGDGSHGPGSCTLTNVPSECCSGHDDRQVSYIFLSVGIIIIIIIIAIIVAIWAGST